MAFLSNLMVGQGQGAADEAGQNAQTNADIAAYLATLGYGTQAGLMNQINAGGAALNPAYNNMGSWLMALTGTPAGTQYTIPGGVNQAVPAGLVPYANAAPGTWQNTVYKWATYNGLQSVPEDIINDITQRKENVIHRLSRAGQGTYKMPPADYVPPSANNADTQMTVPNIGGTTTGADGTNTGGMPSWMGYAAGNWETPYTDAELNQLMEPSELNAQNYATQLQDQLSSDALRRGMSTSPMGQASISIPNAFLANARAQNKATGINMVKGRSDQLRNEAQNGFYNLLGTLTGRQNSLMPTMDFSNTANVFQNKANQWGNTANNFQNQANSNLAGWTQLAGTLASAATGMPMPFGNRGTTGVPAQQNMFNQYPTFGLNGNYWLGR